MALIRAAMTGMSSRPLCPRSWGPQQDPAHRFEVLYQNRLYEAVKPFRQGDDESLPPNLETVYEKVAHNEDTNYMQVHNERTQFLYHGRFVAVEAWFYVCHVCSFVLPATFIDDDLRRAL